MSFSRDHELKVKDEHYTPAFIFDKLQIIFDIDVCAPEGGVSWIPAHRYFTEMDDALIQQWQGRVWMNPPYSRPSPFVEKFIKHGNGIALLVVSRSMWFRDLWAVSDAIVPTPYNMKFERPDGHRKQISFQTFLFAMGKENAEALSRLGDKVR